VVFYEYGSELDGRGYNTKNEDISDLVIDRTEMRTGREVKWVIENSRTTYDLKYAGVSMMKFWIAIAG
jgi:hypothetical protein